MNDIIQIPENEAENVPSEQENEVLAPLITVSQLPIIHEALDRAKAYIDSRVETALSLVCNEETRQSVKKVRAELNKEYDSLNRSYKAALEDVMKPISELEKKYKDCVIGYKTANEQLGAKIKEVEDGLKAEKKSEIEEYFEELKVAEGIDFVTLNQCELKIGLNSSVKSLKKSVDEFINKIKDDLTVINTKENADEIMYEYKQTLDLSKSIAIVHQRHKAMDKARKEREEIKAVQNPAEIKKDVSDMPLAAPKMVKEDAEDDNKVFRFTVEVRGKARANRLISFMNEIGGCSVNGK